MSSYNTNVKTMKQLKKESLIKEKETSKILDMTLKLEVPGMSIPKQATVENEITSFQ